jgi:hypothetical protein
MVGSVFLLGRSELPAELAAVLPARTAPLAVAGRVPVSVAFVSYEPGGALAYEELLVAVATRAGARVRTTVPHIWVDSPESEAGGRALWGIPKGLGRFERRAGGDEVRVRMERDGRAVAALSGRLGPRLRPGWQASSLTTAQRLEGTDHVARNAVRARPRLLRANWDFASDGPLGYLAGRRPLVSLALTEMGISFGVHTERAPAGI